MERFKKIYPFLLFLLLPAVGVDFGKHFLFLLTPMFLLSWGTPLTPLYTGIVSVLYHHDPIEFSFLYQGNMFFNFGAPGYEGLNWDGAALLGMTLNFIRFLPVVVQDVIYIGILWLIKIYEVVLWGLFTVGLFIIIVRLLNRDPEKKAMKKEKAYRLCNFILAFFLPYEIIYAIFGQLSVIGRIYVIVIALLIIAHLVHRRIEKKKEKKA